jgi:hypothetical protein
MGKLIEVSLLEWQQLIELKRSIKFFKTSYTYQRTLEKKQEQFHSLLGDILHRCAA